MQVISASRPERIYPFAGLRPVQFRRPEDQIAIIDANTRVVIALGQPQPGNRNDTLVYRTSVGVSARSESMGSVVPG